MVKRNLQDRPYDDNPISSTPGTTNNTAMTVRALNVSRRKIAKLNARVKNG